MKQKAEVRSQKPEAGARYPEGLRVELNGIDPERLQKINDLLIDGATFSDVVQTLNAEGGEAISDLAVENHFRSNLELQKRRVQRMVEKMDAMKTSLGNPETAEARLAEAVLFTGLMGLTRSPMYADLDDVQVLRLKREKLELERTIQRMRSRESAFRSTLIRARANHEAVKSDKVKYELRKMKDALRELKEGDRLDAITLEKIREVYGIIKEPFIPEAPEATPAPE